VQKFAADVVGPKVREMDENEMMDPAIIQGLFEQGVSPYILLALAHTDDLTADGY
jgi:hypothetical protein